MADLPKAVHKGTR